MKTNYQNDFQTPAEALKPLLPYLNRAWVIWECAEGKGNLTKALREEGYEVIGTDILSGNDFLIWQPDTYDCIITNPPYSLKQKFLERAYSLHKPFAFLLPLTTFETAKRQKLFARYGLEVILLDKRINFETPSGKGSGAWFAVAWFTNKLNIGKQLTFASVAQQDRASDLYSQGWEFESPPKLWRCEKKEK